MADDPKIVPDAPPAEPVPVATPRHDPRPAPPEPVASPIPDPPPWAPHDVKVSPDGPPWSPVDVTTRQDTPPAGTVDVPTLPDSPPGAPVSVPVNPDAPPGVPTPVLISPDPLPAAPVPVSVSTDQLIPPQWPGHSGIPHAFPPDPAHDVPPVDVREDPRDHREPPRYEPPAAPTAESIAAAVRKFDRQVAEFLVEGINGPGSDLVGSLPYSKALDPEYLVSWYQEMLGLQSAQIGGGIGISALAAKFVAEQTLLYSKNDTVAKVFDPAYFVAMSVPGSMGRYTPALDVEFNNNKTVVEARDQDVITNALLGPDPDGGQFGPNTFGPHATADEGLDFTVGTMVDQALQGDSSGYLTPSQADRGALRFDPTKYFDPQPVGYAGSRSVVKPKASPASGGPTEHPDAKLEKAAAMDGILRTSVVGEESDGTILSSGPDPSSVVDDDDAYVPLSFTDLRQGPMVWHEGRGISKTYRTVYFQAMNLRFNVGYSPDYSDLTAFGRVDPVMTYVRTGRTVSLGWEVHAFVPEDLQNMYNKMTWLASMVYPTYGQDGMFQSGPVIRLRIGDVVASDAGGLPGVIKSLSFDFGDCLWELKKGMKVPRSYAVQVDFQVLHDGPVGILEGSFGVLNLPNIGDQPPADQNLAPKGESAGRVPGRFMRFGEPVKKN